MVSTRLWLGFCALLSASSLGCEHESPLTAASPQAKVQPVLESQPEPETEPEETQPEPEETQPEVAPLPPFAGREEVSVDELLAALTDELPALAASESIRADYEAFLTDFELEDSEALYLDYVRVKLAFEATRDGGWWGLEWTITNEQPNSEKVWAQWQDLGDELAWSEDGQLPELPVTTALAECDELSALFAFFARRIGLERDSHVGLFWPTGNHVVAVWIIGAKDERPTRVIVPTTQIFLEGDASLGDRGFNPWKQRKIFDYRRQDIPGDASLPGPLASYFVAQVRAHGADSQARQLEHMAARMDAQL